MKWKKFLILWKIFDRRRKVEAVWKELCSSGQHKLVWLSDSDVGHSGDVRDFSLSFLVVRRLWRHVDRRRSDGDGRSSGHDVEVDRPFSDVRCGFLNFARKSEGSAESVHEVSGLDDVDVGVVRLQDQLEAAANLLFADCTDSHNLFECSRYAFLKSKKNRKLVVIIIVNY